MGPRGSQPDQPTDRHPRAPLAPSLRPSQRGTQKTLFLLSRGQRPLGGGHVGCFCLQPAPLAFRRLACGIQWLVFCQVHGLSHFRTPKTGSRREHLESAGTAQRDRAGEEPLGQGALWTPPPPLETECPTVCQLRQHARGGGVSSGAAGPAHRVQAVSKIPGALHLGVCTLLPELGCRGGAPTRLSAQLAQECPPPACPVAAREPV